MVPNSPAWPSDIPPAVRGFVQDVTYLIQHPAHRLVNTHDRPEHNHAIATTRTPNWRLLERGGIDGDSTHAGEVAATSPKRFHGSIELPAASAALKFSDLMNEVVQHFSSDPDNEVKIRVEVEASSNQGFDENVQRTVRENSNTLGLNSSEFEEE